ncbi:hypothetical protein Verru16b_02985 [Lacunisphaera limnophila]|uniref:Methyltransferase FkbM domain-containing protein n=1 Tax=Lacunisphaera limnophila TaxID=1838286 RepID=A0A1D8AYF2_9BACT|nr:FkbM family methyltransferase [Lacunisphaera limnophila]AOS45894.1 hypothetical protein Verru16b_02985 [Lacunisphaera limnophila]
MRNLIKKGLQTLLGERGAAGLIRRLKGQPRTFAEADLIYDYFLERRTPGVMVDVGAHFGESFLPYLAKRWRILAFEPDSKNRTRLLGNARAEDIRLFPVAVSDHEAEEVAFFASDESDGISSLSAFRPTHHETERVRICTLRRVLAEEGVEQVEFLKIDTEGHDLFVLKGFPWENIRPQVVLCEFEDIKTVPLGYDYRQMGDYLVDKGYVVFLSEWAPIARYGVTHTWKSWRRYPCTLSDSMAWGNFVAFKPGSSMQAVEEYLSTIVEGRIR